MKRPRFGKKGGRQVRTVKGVKVGHMYIQIYTRLEIERSELIKVLDGPFELSLTVGARDRGKATCVNVAIIDTDGKTKDKQLITLGDKSILPYNDGTWNDTNCLLRTTAKSSKFFTRINPAAYRPTHIDQ